MDDDLPRRGRSALWWVAGSTLVGTIMGIVAGVWSDQSFLPLVGVAVLGPSWAW
jgi:hypothetical protein